MSHRSDSGAAAVLDPALAERLKRFPPSRYMGSKLAILPFLESVLREQPFETALDAFSGSGAVSYLLKAMGKTVWSNDFLAIGYHAARACVANEDTTLAPVAVAALLQPHPTAGDLVQRTFGGLYFSDEENALLDHLLARLADLPEGSAERSLATAAAVRACLARRPRGVFTYTGWRYDDGRRDLATSLADHIRQAAERLNAAVFATGRDHRAYHGDVFALPEDVQPDLVYIDPPYVSPHSDNDYTRRYHFVEGLARGWHGLEIQPQTRTKKFRRLASRFDQRATIHEAFADLFGRYQSSILVVSYGSNAIPTAVEMEALLRRYKRTVTVHACPHRYSFGTHGHRVRSNHNAVAEYVFVGR